MSNDEAREQDRTDGSGASHGHDSAGERLADRLTQQLAQQWAHLRAERRAEAAVQPVRPGVSNFSRAQVPWGLDLAAAWSWRFLVIVAAGYVILWTVNRFALLAFPLAIALLLAALVSPMVRAARNVGMPSSLSSLFGVVLTFGVVGVLLTFAGQQVASGATELAGEVVKGLEEIRDWLRDGPLNASDSQINDYIGEAQVAITEWSKSDALGQAATLGTAIGNVTAGFFIVLFAMYFFLADGERIWTWIVRLSPRAARQHVDASGRVAWVSLTQFVRATIIVAVVDSLGIMAVAWWLDVPLVLAIGVLVFLGAFVPMIGATIAGAVAVLVALVDQGPLAALFMLIGVIVVQQVEGNVLQPFLMGRFVSVHPLGVIVAIAMGLILAGIGGALVAVPLVAAINAVVMHLAGHADPDEIATTDAEEELLEPDEPEPHDPLPGETSEATP